MQIAQQDLLDVDVFMLAATILVQGALLNYGEYILYKYYKTCALHMTVNNIHRVYCKELGIMDLQLFVFQEL